MRSSPEEGPLVTVLVWLFGLGAVPLVAGLVARARAIRMRRILSAYPWRELPAHLSEVRMPTPNGQLMVLLDNPPGEGPVLSLPTWVWRWRRLLSLELETVWLAGKPDRGAVLAPPGGGELFWA